jgi:hypothetical protein
MRERGPEAWPRKDPTMKVMVIIKTTKNAEAGVMPGEQPLTAMGKYKEALLERRPPHALVFYRE